MKIIHTADWHLCDRLGRIDRTSDLQNRVESIARLCEEHQVDVLLIAGDLFSEQATPDEMTKALQHIRECFRGFFNNGGTVLALTGNHDRDGRINMVRAGMTLAAPIAGRDGVAAGGRMYLLNGRMVTKLRGADGQCVQFVIVPYPFASRYDLSAANYRSKEEENRLLHTKVAEWISQSSKSDSFDPRLPTVLAAHLHVRGAEVHKLYKMTERDDVLFDFADLNPMWSYVALGHIHQPQTMNGSETVRYSGSLDRLDFGETHDDHGVVLLEVQGAKTVEPIRLPIRATPFHTITIADVETELSTLKEKYPDHETAIVRLRVTPSTVKSCDEVGRELRKLFPRWHELTWTSQDVPEKEAVSVQFNKNQSFETTVRDYLTGALINDPNKDALLELVDRYLSERNES